MDGSTGSSTLVTNLKSIDLRHAVEAFRNANAMLSFGGLFILYGLAFIPVSIFFQQQLLVRMYVDPGSIEWDATMLAALTPLVILPVGAVVGFFAVGTGRYRLALGLWLLFVGNYFLGSILSLVGSGDLFDRAGMYLDSAAVARMVAPMLFVALIAIAAFRMIISGVSLSKFDRSIARPAHDLQDFPTLLRYMFGVWPGLRRSWFAAAASSVLAYLSTLVANIGVVLRVFLMVLAVTAPISLLLSSSMASRNIGINQAVGGVVALAIAAGLAYLFAVLLRFVAQVLRAGARRFSRQSLDRQVARDQRPPILFLRSFADDQVTLPQTGFWSRLMRSEGRRRRLDHMLVENFASYGPVVAIGRPGERSLPFGAARIYVTDDKWQEVVTDLAMKARAVVLLADPTPGVGWEVETMIGEAFRQKTLFLAPPKSTGLAQNPLVQSLARNLGAPDGLPLRAVAMYFEPTGTMTVLKSQEFVADAYHVALQAFFRREARSSVSVT